MEKEFIPYEQALALKELGFNEPCVFLYYNYGSNYVIGEPLIKNSDLSGNEEITAPLFSQAFRWFREKYDIQLGICHIHGGFDCWTNDGDLFENGKYCNFKTYEEAEIECLKKLIEIVKEKS